MWVSNYYLIQNTINFQIKTQKIAKKINLLKTQ